MVFSSIPFLFGFLPVVLAGYHVLPRRARNTWLLAASLIFYTWETGALVFLLVGAMVVDYAGGRLVWTGKRNGSARLVRAGVLLSVVMSLAMLAYFKYANFVVAQINVLASKLGWGAIAWDSVVLPIGISFYTFHMISYTLDLVKGRAEMTKSFPDFALYVTLFPQLVAGPIVRYHEIADQLRERAHSVERFADGVVRFALGLGKKVIIADSVALIADAAFGAEPGALSAAAAWAGILAYTLQIYFDFSGYSDMAIGLGLMFGFRLPENFRRPYSALSITDFWRRWHMTLSKWFRDYVYVPLGGSRGTGVRTYMNLWIVFVLTGFWHGANWTFVAWGAYHGALLTLERRTGQRAFEERRPLAHVARRAWVLLAVMVGWVFFRAPDIGAALGYLGAMAGQTAGSGAPIASALTNRAVAAMALGAASLLLPGSYVTGPVLEAQRTRLVAAGRWAVAVAGLLYSSILLSGGSFSPFLYFQF